MNTLLTAGPCVWPTSQLRVTVHLPIFSGMDALNPSILCSSCTPPLSYLLSLTLILLPVLSLPLRPKNDIWILFSSISKIQQQLSLVFNDPK